MKDNDFERYIKEVASNIHHSFLKKMGNLYLSDEEVSILNKYKIDYKSCSDYHSLLYLIDNLLEYDTYDDLENLAKDISERNYYLYTNK